MGKRILALDIGNTRIKWGLAEASAWIEGGATEHNLVEKLLLEWDRLPAPDKIIGSNVAGETRIAILTKYWRARGLEISWIKPGVMSCGVTNNYEQPEQLGTDRWAALIGAWHKARLPCLVVSAGTAMTIDMLDEQGRFMGGQILPGRRLMQECLVKGAHALAAETGQVKECPLNTADAMATGIANALVSPIESAFHRLESWTRTKPACLIAGGDAAWLAGQLKIACRVEAGLVLDGLLKMSEEEIQS
jgi:type III pantothenate kinase